MTIPISRVFAAAALVACIPLSNAHADVAPVDATPTSSTASEAVGDLVVSGGFARAMLPGAKVAGGYLTIGNSGSEADRLVSVSSPAAGRVELHEMAMEGDVMRMRALTDGLTIAPGEAVSLRPGGKHLMFFDVAEPFEEGVSIPVTLTFEHAGPVEAALAVLSAGATQAEQK